MLWIQFKLDSKFKQQKNKRERGFVEFCATVIRILNIFSAALRSIRESLGGNKKKWWKIKYCRLEKRRCALKGHLIRFERERKTRPISQKWLFHNSETHFILFLAILSPSSFQHLFLAEIFSAWNLFFFSNFSLFVISFAALFTMLNCLSVTQ